MVEALQSLTQWLVEHWLLVLPLILGFLSIWLLLPQARRRPIGPAVGLGVAALALIGLGHLATVGLNVEQVLFYIFAAMAVVSGACMIVQSNPVYAALWFALVILSTCGLFLLQAAQFLAAATIIVYAGAIIVTFLFVIMLAQQSGVATYDRRAREPLLASLAGFVLLGALLYTLDATYRPTPASEDMSPADAAAQRLLLVPASVAARASPLSKPDDSAGHVASLGRTLFTDYLWAVELAGTLLLVATIGAIAISARRAEVSR